MIRVILSALIVLLFAAPSFAQEYVDCIVKIVTPEKGAAPAVNGVKLLNYFPLAVDGTKTIYLVRCSRDKQDIMLKPYFDTAKNGDAIWTGAKAWNEWQKADAANAEKVLVYDRATTVDGKPTIETVSMEAAKADPTYDKAKVRVPVKFSGTTPAFAAKDLAVVAVPAGEAEVPR